MRKKTGRERGVLTRVRFDFDDCVRLLVERGSARSDAIENLEWLAVRQRRYLYLDLLGRCVRCALPREDTSKLCAGCKLVAKKWQVETGFGKSRPGKCGQCGKKSAAYRCAVCREKRRQRYAKRGARC